MLGEELQNEKATNIQHGAMRKKQKALWVTRDE